MLALSLRSSHPANRTESPKGRTASLQRTLDGTSIVVRYEGTSFAWYRECLHQSHLICVARYPCLSSLITQQSPLCMKKEAERDDEQRSNLPRRSNSEDAKMKRGAWRKMQALKIQFKTVGNRHLPWKSRDIPTHPETVCTASRGQLYLCPGTTGQNIILSYSVTEALSLVLFCRP